MGRSRISYLIPGTVLAAFVCIMAGLEAYPQSIKAVQRTAVPDPGEYEKCRDDDADAVQC